MRVYWQLRIGQKPHSEKRTSQAVAQIVIRSLEEIALLA